MAHAGFTVAVSHRSKHNGEWQDVNDGFFRCTAWRSNAENAAHTLKKGMRVFVAGKLVQRNWQDNGGNFRSRSIPSDCDLERLRPEASAPFCRGSFSCRTASQPTLGGPTSFGTNKRQSVEIQVTHVGPDLQFQSVEEEATSTGEKQRA